MVWLLVLVVAFFPGNVNLEPCTLSRPEEMVCINPTSIDLFEKFSLEQFDKVTRFTMRDGNISEIPPNNFFLKFPNVREMSLTNLSLQVIIPTTSIMPSPLQSLNLSDNQLTETVLENLPSGGQIKVLKLKHNQIKSINSQCLLNIGDILEIADFSHNQISWIGLNTFTGLKKLHTLDLFNNKLEILEKKLFVDLVSLKVLNLGYNYITALPLGILENCKNLEVLHIHDNLLTKLNEVVYPLKNLQKLSFSLNKIPSIDIEKLLTELPKLRSIWLNFNPFNCSLYQHITDVVATHGQIKLDLSLYKEIMDGKGNVCKIKPKMDLGKRNHSVGIETINRYLKSTNTTMTQLLDSYFLESPVFGALAEALNKTKCKCGCPKQLEKPTYM